MGDQLEQYWNVLEAAQSEFIENFYSDEPADDVMLAIEQAFVAGFRSGYFEGLDRGMELEHEVNIKEREDERRDI